MFPQSHRLTRQRDIQRLYKASKTAGTQSLFIRALANRLNHSRYSVVIGKKVAKKAVVRNRLKRLVRQAIQELTSEKRLPNQNLDILLTIHREPAEPYSLERSKPEVAECFARLP
jgi:ribonuclease P protein component